MHQSIKQQVMTIPLQQLSGSSFTEALSLASTLEDSGHTFTHTSTEEQLKSIPKKSYR